MDFMGMEESIANALGRNTASHSIIVRKKKLLVSLRMVNTGAIKSVKDITIVIRRKPK